MSVYMEDYLKPIICAAGTYTKDSSNKVLQNFKKLFSVLQSRLLVIVDIKLLYSSILYQEKLNALSIKLEQE